MQYATANKHTVENTFTATDVSITVQITTDTAEVEK